MTFTTEAWSRTAALRAAIDDLPFLAELEDGSLSRETFEWYLAQDALYLAEYARVLAGLATRATDPEHTRFWSKAAHDAVVVERELHGSHVADLSEAPMAPTCRGYTAYLLSLLHGPYEVAVAGVLPCFWIYQDVGSRLLSRVGDTTGHPYGDWIATYADEAFEQSVVEAKEITDACADAAPGARAAMDLAYDTASRYEWMFWAAAHDREEWPV